LGAIDISSDREVFGIRRNNLAFDARFSSDAGERASPMRCTAWNTAEVEQSQRFDYYRSALCDSFAHLTPHKLLEAGNFFALVERWNGDCGEFTRMVTSTHCVSRTRRDIAKGPDDHLYLNFIERGEMAFEQFGSRYLLRPGDLVMVDNAYVFQAQSNARDVHRHLAFRIDRQALSGDTTGITQRITKHELTPALRQILTYLCRANPAWSAEHLARVVAAVRSLTLTILFGHAEAEAHRTAILDRIKMMISARMGDPEFSLDEVARSLKMSRRSVQKYLQANNLSFSMMLLDARLEQALLILLRSNGRVCMEEISFRCGFGELSTFYRAFKARFGVPPAAYRDRLLNRS
jgi:AraC family transcriptional activator of tynA and feaB